PHLFQQAIFGNVAFSTNRPRTSTPATAIDTPSHGRWTTDEDERLKKGIKLYGEGKWMLISTLVGTRSSQQCITRWRTCLAPNIKKGKWTNEESELLEQGIKLFGEGKWVEIAQTVPGRTPEQCWAHWNRTISPHIKKGRWTQEEDELLKAAVVMFGERHWTLIAANVPGRTGLQCSSRWRDVLRPGIKRGKWTQEEDELLWISIEKHGLGKWQAISDDVPGRTRLNCLGRWRQLEKMRKKENGGRKSCQFVNQID
ncbi:Myb-like DNA-binding domain protein, partial [Quaeritorhiza haematococci]